MKLTTQMLREMIEEVLKEGDDERPWYHGPWESDWDRKQKTKECEDGNQEACDELAADKNEWEQMLDRWTGKESEPMHVPGTTRQSPEMPFQDADMRRAVDAVNKPMKVDFRKGVKP